MSLFGSKNLNILLLACGTIYAYDTSHMSKMLYFLCFPSRYIFFAQPICSPSLFPQKQYVPTVQKLLPFILCACGFFLFDTDFWLNDNNLPSQNQLSTFFFLFKQYYLSLSSLKALQAFLYTVKCKVCLCVVNNK